MDPTFQWLFNLVYDYCLGLVVFLLLLLLRSAFSSLFLLSIFSSQKHLLGCFQSAHKMSAHLSRSSAFSAALTTLLQGVPLDSGHLCVLFSSTASPTTCSIRKLGGAGWLVCLVHLPGCMLSLDSLFARCELFIEFCSLTWVSSGFLVCFRYAGMDFCGSPSLTLRLPQLGVLRDYYFVISGSFVFSCSSPKVAKWLNDAIPAFSSTIRPGWLFFCWLRSLVLTCGSPNRSCLYMQPSRRFMSAWFCWCRFCCTVRLSCQLIVRSVGTSFGGPACNFNLVSC